MCKSNLKFPSNQRIQISFMRSINLFRSWGLMFWHQQSKRSTSTSRTLKSTPVAPPPLFLRTPKLSLRHMRRKNNFGVLTSRYVGAACCPHIVDRSVCENRPKTLLKKAVVSSLPSPLTPNRPAALQSSSKALEIRQQSVGCFRSFFTCFAHQHHPPK